MSHSHRLPQTTVLDGRVSGMRGIRTSPRGAVLVCVLVCVGIASTIMLTSLTASLRARRQVRRELQMEQTRWIAEAALIRGVQQRASQSNYQGERWDVQNAFPGYAIAEAVIDISADESADGSSRLAVTASLGGLDPRAPITRHSAERQLPKTGDLPQSGDDGETP